MDYTETYAKKKVSIAITWNKTTRTTITEILDTIMFAKLVKRVRN